MWLIQRLSEPEPEIWRNNLTSFEFETTEGFNDLQDWLW